MPIRGVISDYNTIGATLIIILSHCYMRLPNHKPFTKTKITVSTLPKVYAVSEEHIGILIFSGYYFKNGYTVHCNLLKCKYNRVKVPTKTVGICMIFNIRLIEAPRYIFFPVIQIMDIATVGSNICANQGYDYCVLIPLHA